MNVDEMAQAAKEWSAIVEVRNLAEGDIYVIYANGAAGRYGNIDQAKRMSEYYRLSWKPPRKCPWGRCNGYGSDGGFDGICSCSPD